MSVADDSAQDANAAILHVVVNLEAEAALRKRVVERQE
jgi:hypothetical protein